MSKTYNFVRSVTIHSRNGVCNSAKRHKKPSGGVTFFSTLGIVLMFALFGSINAYSQTTYYSKSTAVDFNNVASWGTGTDGTGTEPASISNADNFIVANNAAIVLSGNAAVRQLTVNSGNLTVAANTLTISKATGFDTSFTVNSGGTLTVTGGSIVLNGGFTLANGGNFTQSGGNITVDGNDGGLPASSVASGTPIFRIGTSATSYSTGTLNLTGGTITIVDPHTATTNTSGYALYVNFPSGFNVESGAGHTFAFGNGVSADAGGHTSGFYADPYVGSGRLNLGNLVINNPTGTNRAVVTPFNFGVHGNATLTAGEMRLTGGMVLRGNLNVTGGVYIASSGLTLATPSGTSNTANTVAQTVTITAPGVVKNAVTGETTNFTTVTVNNTSAGGVTFNGNSNISTQPANSVSTNTVAFTAGKIATSGNAIFVLGNSSPSAGTLTYTSGGFASGTTFGRWFTAAGTGSAFTAGTDVSSTTSRYPFVNSTGQDRSAWIERVGPTSAVGILGMTYTNNAGLSTVSLTDGSVAVDTRGNDTWAISSVQGNATSATSFKLQIQAPGLFVYPLGVASARLVQGATFVGAHQAGTTTPGAQRITLSAAELVAAPFSMVTSTGDIAFASIASGNWNDATTWNKGTVPTCNDIVFVSAGHTVTANSAGATAKNLTVSVGGTLVMASNDLTVGCTLKNNTFTNNGTFTMNGGTFTVNGNMLHAAGSTFNHTAGDINVDGNDGGNAASSVASGTSIVQISTQLLNWTGGTLTIVDPHANSTASNSFTFTNSTANVNVTSGHTIRFGDGVSTDAGGNATNGFRVATFPGSNRISFNNFVVNGGTGTNRFVSVASAYGINGNLTINANSEYRDNGVTTHVAGNVVNNGLYVATGTLAFQSFLGGTAAAVTTAQTVTGTGTFANLATAPTANFNSITINNTSAGGVSIPAASNIASQPANSVSASGTLTFTAGKLYPGGNLFVLGTSVPAAGTLTYTAGGFPTGVTFGRWYTATGGGSSFTAGTDATSGTSRYPFVNSTGQDRSAWIERVTAAAATGILGVTYTNTAGTSAIAVSDGTVAVDIKANDTWGVTAISGTPLAAASFKLQIQAPGIFGTILSTPAARIIQGNAFVGAHQVGTITPGGQRVNLTGAELTAAPFTLVVSSADIPTYAVTSGDWNNAATWSKNLVPVCSDGVIIPAGMTVTVNSAANVAKQVSIAATGTLIVASGDLTIGCTDKNSLFNNAGTLTITGGTINLNGSFNMVNGANLTQSGGDFNIDGNNNGDAATSVASGTPIFRIGTSAASYSSGTITLTGGTITIVDPHTAGTSTTGYAVYVYFPSGFSVESGDDHTFRFGNGASADAGGHTSGFYVDTYVSSGRLNLGNFVVDNPTGTNRNVVTPFAIGVHGKINVIAGDFRPSALILKGDLSVTGGSYTATGALTLAAPLATGSAVNTGTQTLSFDSPGVIRNAATGETANFTAITVNNSNATGVTMASPFTMSGTLTLTSGKVNTTNTNLLTVMGTTTGSVSGGSATAYVNGPLARGIASGNTTGTYYHFPVGKATYSPVWLAPAATTAAVMKAEAFDANGGTMDASIINLSTGKRWEAPLVSGTITDINVRLGDAALAAINIPVMAPSANGIYSALFGSVGTFAAGTPNTIQSTTPSSAANYTGFLSFAESNLCSGVPVPGLTIASDSDLCAGASVTLSVQNVTTGSGVTYQWQSSVDGVAFTDIAGATSATYTTTPTAALHYRLNVTCSNGPVSAVSTPVHVTFTHSVTGTTPASRCGNGTVTLAATGSAGSTIKWYSSATSTTELASGGTYTPTVSATTTYYVTAGVGSPALSGGKPAPEATWDTFNTTNWGIVVNAIQSTTLESVDVYSTTAGTIDVKITNATGTELYATGNVNVAAGGTTTPTTIPLNFAVTAGSSYRILVKAYSGISLVRGSTNLAFPYVNADISVPASEWGGTTTGTYYFFYNVRTGSGCFSPRVPVVATVTPAPVVTLSATSTSVCVGQTSSAVTVTAGAADYDSFVWSPSTGVSGNATTGWTFNPATTTTYTLTATQSAGAQCAIEPIQFVVTVNALPVINTSLPEEEETCMNEIQQLIFSGSSPATVTSGTAASTSTASSTAAALGPNPLQNYYGGTKQQWMYTAAELTAMGFAANSQITSMSLNLAASNTTALQALTIKMKNTTASSFATTTSWITDLVTVRPAANHTPSVGQNVFTLTTPFVWDGTSNLVIEMSYSNNNGGSGSVNTARYSPTSFVSTIFYRADDATAATITGYTGAASFTYSSRNDVTFVITSPLPVTWSPATNLYTDAGATVAYVPGANAGTVYVKSATTGETTYTATVTNASGCSATDTVEVTVLDCSIGWANLQWPANGTINTCGTHDVYARVYKQNVTEAPGANANISAWIGVSTTNTDPSTWTEADWHLATFNVQDGNNDEYTYAISGLPAGTYYYASRFRYLEGPFAYGGFQGGPWNGTSNVNGVLTVNAIAAPTAAAAQTVCSPATVANLIATGDTGAIIKWYSAATGGTALASTAVLSNGVYYASQTVGGCESTARVAVTVTLSTIAVPTTDSVQPTCAVATGSITVSAPVGAEYTYSKDGTTFQASPVFADLASGSYTITVKNAANCTATATVVINEAPAAPATPMASVTQPTCAVATGIITVTSPVGTGLTYSIDGTTFVSTAVFSGLSAGTYTVTVKNASDCTATSVALTINAAPAVPAAPTAAPLSFCNQAVTVADLTATGSGLQWYANETGGTAIPATETVTSGTYYVSQTVGVCESTRTSVVVTVNTVLAPTGAATQQITASTAPDATIEDIQVTASGTVTWYATAEDAENGEDPLPAGTQLVSGNTYYGTQTVGTCESAYIAVTVDVVLGKEDFNANAFKVYPNPVKDVLRISYTSEITSVEVFNMLGQKVLAKQPGVTEAVIDMAGLADATYIVNVTSGNIVKTIKVVKKQ